MTSDRRPGLKWTQHAPDVPDLPAADLLEQARVALTEGEQFGLGGEGYVRFNFATDVETLTAIVDRMAAARPVSAGG